jgi:PAS domain S-box-containing protein
VLCGDEDFVPIAWSLHRRAFEDVVPFGVDVLLAGEHLDHRASRRDMPESDDVRAASAQSAGGEHAMTQEAPIQPSPLDCLAGGGHMGALMRAKDWSQTPLGPVASWPQSLRTSVSIMLSSGFAVVVAWGEAFIFLYNDRYRPVLGATKHPMALGSRSADIFPEVWDFIGPLFRKTRDGETVALDDVLIPLDRNGYLEECFFTLSYSPIRDESGGIGGMLAIVAETTERVQGERRLRTLRDLAAVAPRAETADEACANAAATLAENPTDVPFGLLFLVGDDGQEVRFARGCGLGDSIATDPAAWPLGEAGRQGRRVVVPELGARFGALPGGTYPEPTHTAVILPLARPGVDHPYGYLVAGVSPRRELDDTYEGFFDLVAEHIVTAITNALAREAERKRAEVLAELDRAKTAFFSNVSHEFRTPLTLMIGPTEDALASPGHALTGENLITVHRNALRLLKLVNTLLDFSRIEAGRAQARFEEADLGAMTMDLASAFRSAIEKAGLRYDIDCPRIPGPAWVDAAMWEKIVLNLISNAFKFTFDGGIRVVLQQVAQRVELAVSDTGIGIAEHELPRVFERFHRIEGARSRTHEGSGIGLALVHDLVRLHGGSIAVTSRIGEGTTFTVSLPTGKAHLPADHVGDHPKLVSTAVRAEAFVAEALRWLPDQPGEAGTAPSPPSRLPSRVARILVADDNADMRDYLVRLLGQHSQVVAAADGEQALALVRSERPDLVLTDVMMPRLDGFGLLRALRADDDMRRIPVLMLSARAGEESRVEGLEAGADDYLVKPFSARELVARVNTHLDLSRLRREAEIQREKLHALFEQAPAVICVLTGPDHVYELANPSYLETIGERDVVGKPIREALPELAGQGIFELLDDCYRSGEPVTRAESQIRLMRRNGIQDTYWNFVWQPYRDADGRVAGIMVFGFEITELVVARQRVEALAAELQASNRAREQSEQQFRTLADSLPLMAWYAHPDGYVPWYNQRWYEYTGMTPDTQGGRHWGSVHDPDDLPRVTAKWQAALASGEPWEDQFRLRRHDGEYRWFLSRAIPVRDAYGHIVRWFGTNVDIHDQKRAEKVAEAANRAKDEFLAVLGHELRNPLAPIVTAVQLMKLRDPEHHGKERTVIERQAQHLVRLVDDLLDVSRITRGKVELKRRRVELSEVVAMAIETASPLFEQRRHRLEVDVPPHGLGIHGDPERLAQVVANLLTNAAKYTNPGGRILVGARRDGDHVVMRVQDNGTGIAPELLPRVFDMFVQDGQALDRSQGGLGLGLTIVRSLVELHGGSVEARSAGVHRGAEFIVRLPAFAHTDAEGRSPLISGDHAGPAPNAKLRILVVDDNQDAADLLAATLELLGHRTRIAHDGPEALAAATEFAPDVALLDIGLPVMDGYELAQRLRQQRASAALKLVAITGYGQEADRSLSQAAGFLDHLVKPVDVSSLQGVLQRIGRDAHESEHR